MGWWRGGGGGVGRRGDDDDLGPDLLQHLLPALEDTGDAVLVRDGFGLGGVALADGHDLAAVGLEGRDVGAAETEPDDAHRVRTTRHG